MCHGIPAQSDGVQFWQKWGDSCERNINSGLRKVRDASPFQNARVSAVICELPCLSAIVSPVAQRSQVFRELRKALVICDGVVNRRKGVR